MDIDIRLEKFQGTSKKSGSKFDCFKLTIGDYETLIFPRSPMETNYLNRLIDEGEI